jgi:hypothetical protein
MNETARQLLSVFMSSGQEVDFLKAIVGKSLEGEQQSSTLFRGNSLASKAIEQVRVSVLLYFESNGCCNRDIILFCDLLVVHERNCVALPPSRYIRPNHYVVGGEAFV